MPEPAPEPPAAEAPQAPAAAEAHRGGFGEFAGSADGLIDRAFRERIIVVGVTVDGEDPAVTERSLDELELLVSTAGADAVQRVHQRRQAPDPATYVGRGKADEIRTLAEALDCDTVVFDDELSPAQQFNLEKTLGRSAIDRTAVILDIFAQNAGSSEGKAQVELAQLRYRLPRLRGSGLALSQQGGGIGTRGPGETRLEVDRRRLIRRVHKLEADLAKVGAHRANQAKRRRRTRNRSVALVGYTNAGKSSLLNRLTDAEAETADRLFATLDTATRRLALPGGETVFVTDTVGFVRKLPHQLVKAFATTLDVVRDADLLVHVVDGAGSDPQGSIRAVRSVLAEIGAADICELLVFNKCDRFAPEPAVGSGTGNGSGAGLGTGNGPDAGGNGLGGADRALGNGSGSVAGGMGCDLAVSARTGENLDLLRSLIAERLRSLSGVYELSVPWKRGDVLASLHREGQVLSETPTETGMRITARLEPASAGALRAYLTSTPAGSVAEPMPPEPDSDPTPPADAVSPGPAVGPVSSADDGAAV